mmetsp:Transcript_33185/g.71709  ORF Transcript_33185/g.71709 Transcript_33185/m.71709 type:complete len:212 (-) Transcript_33185:85-720(-)
MEVRLAHGGWKGRLHFPSQMRRGAVGSMRHSASRHSVQIQVNSRLEESSVAALHFGGGVVSVFLVCFALRPFFLGGGVVGRASSLFSTTAIVSAGDLSLFSSPPLLLSLRFSLVLFRWGDGACDSSLISCPFLILLFCFATSASTPFVAATGIDLSWDLFSSPSSASPLCSGIDICCFVQSSLQCNQQNPLWYCMLVFLKSCSVLFCSVVV